MAYMTDTAKEYAKKKKVRDNEKNDELSRLDTAGKEYSNLFNNKIYPILNELYYIYIALANTDEQLYEDVLFDVIDTLDTSKIDLAQYVSDTLDSPSAYDYDEDESKVEKYMKAIKTKTDIQKYVAPYIRKLTDALKSIPAIFRKHGFKTVDELVNAETKYNHHISYNINFDRLYDVASIKDSCTKDDGKNYHSLYVQMQLDYDKALAQIDKIVDDFWKKYPESTINALYKHGDFAPGDLDCPFKSDMGYSHNGHLTKEEAIEEADDKNVK